MNTSIIEKIKTAPKQPGVYFFYNRGCALYVGKAADLRARLKSYLKIADIKTQSLHEEADRLDFVVLRSDIEALIEESRLIKELKPKYNVVFRDDKSYSYVYFTKENFPKIFTAHERPRRFASASRIGPFTDSGTLRLVMKLLRRALPYCTCRRPHLRDCLNAQIGKCPGICCRKNSLAHRAEYLKIIRKIKKALRGQNRKLLATLTDEKERAALEKIFEHKDFLANSKSQIANLPKAIGPLLFAVSKIECYDNSNFAGKEAVGALTTLVKINSEWRPDKNSYRKFIIKSTPTRDDPRMIGELISRRLNHPEWPYPDLIIIDGGLTQFRAAREALQKLKIENLKLKIISYAKPHRLVYGLRDNDLPIPLLQLPKELQQLIELAIYQTHNFAIRFHREKRAKEFIPQE